MRLIVIILLTITCTQQVDFDLRKIKFRGLEFSTTRNSIIKSFGQPNLEQALNCGFNENEESESFDRQLIYDNFIYVGGYQDSFVLQTVDFDTIGKIKLNYNNIELNGLTTKEDFIKMFGEVAKKYFDGHSDKNSILLMMKDSDVGANFHFKDDKLTKYDYWTPC